MLRLSGSLYRLRLSIPLIRLLGVGLIRLSAIALIGLLSAIALIGRLVIAGIRRLLTIALIRLIRRLTVAGIRLSARIARLWPAESDDGGDDRQQLNDDHEYADDKHRAIIAVGVVAVIRYGGCGADCTDNEKDKQRQTRDHHQHAACNAIAEHDASAHQIG